MRRALSDDAISFFHTNYLFFPFGTSLVNHSHYALPALIAATVFGSAPIVLAQNLLVLTHVFLNGFAMYGLAWSVTGHWRASILAGVLFGTSPYLASHLLGHFELLAAWPLPAFAWALRRASFRGSKVAVAAAAAVLVATAYTTYYYVVYLAIFALTWLAASTGVVSCSIGPRPPSSWIHILRAALIALIAGTSILVLWILSTGGAMVTLGPLALSMTRTHNPLTFVWLLSICLWLSFRRVAIRIDVSKPGVVRAAAVLAMVAAVFVIGTAPLLWRAAALVRAGEYVSPAYVWRSATAGVDLIAPMLGHPFHAVEGHQSRELYEAARIDIVESVAWIGIVPCLMLLFFRVDRVHRAEAVCWWSVAAVFGLWALGPNLMIGGADVGLPLPQTLARFIPIVANARIPGRAMVMVYLAFAVLAAMRVSGARGLWARPALQWVLIAGVLLDYMAAPIALTGASQPAPYTQLAAAPAGGVCHVPFVMGDGLRTFGPYDLGVVYSATLHGHPIAGGFLSRMPHDAAVRYAAMPIAGDLLALSGGTAVGPFRGSTVGSPCAYLVVDRARVSAQDRDFLGTLPLRPLASGDGIEVYVLQADRP